MLTKYVGRNTWLHGKRLYDILSRLKEFGKGRIVYRNLFHERYPEASYYVISGAKPDMRDPTDKENKKYKSYAYATKVFRGELIGDNQEIRSCYKNDWRLVPRCDEKAFLAARADVKRAPKEPIDTTFDLPPLMRMLFRQREKYADPGTPLPAPRINVHTSKYNRV